MKEYYYFFVLVLFAAIATSVAAAGPVNHQHYGLLKIPKHTRRIQQDSHLPSETKSNATTARTPHLRGASAAHSSSANHTSTGEETGDKRHHNTNGIVKGNSTKHHVSHIYFPTSIDVFEVRKDHRNRSVSRGNVPKVLYLTVPTYKTTAEHSMSFHEMRRAFQCASDEPALNEMNGAMALMEYMPPTRETLDLMCAWAEVRCGPWTECKRLANLFKEGKYPKKFGMESYDGFSSFTLVKIQNNTLYQGWPWGAYRMQVNYTITSNQLLADIVTFIHDLPDSVFFYGGERPYLPMNFPFPGFSAASKLGTSNIAWPFAEGYRSELALHVDIHTKGFDIKNESSLDIVLNRKPWHERSKKAAFFAHMDVFRRVIFEVARANPDLFDVSANRQNQLNPFNPLSDEGTVSDENVKDNRNASDPFGYAGAMYTMPHDRNYNAAHYKYVIVPLGQTGLSTSGRIFSLLARSKSVMLLQKGPFSYHFGDRLRPWVHYVPFSETGAELADIVRWLHDHDDLAQRIAENSYNFGQSYLRLEDYYCYGATVLHEIGNLMKGSTILSEPFNMQRATIVATF